jgi:hypothetical protein
MPTPPLPRPVAPAHVRRPRRPAVAADAQPSPASARCSRFWPVGEDGPVAGQQPPGGDQLASVRLTGEREPRSQRLAAQDDTGVPHGRCARLGCATGAGRGVRPAMGDADPSGDAVVGHSARTTTRVSAGAGVSRSVTSSPSTRTRPAAMCSSIRSSDSPAAASQSRTVVGGGSSAVTP